MNLTATIPVEHECKWVKNDAKDTNGNYLWTCIHSHWCQLEDKLWLPPGEVPKTGKVVSNW